MKKISFFLAFLTASFISFSQDVTYVSDSILNEGRMLYQSESASWYGTDIFLSKYKYREKVGGYFSYNEKDKFKCIFFSNDATPKVIGEITFDNKFDVNTAVDNLTEREFTKQESELYWMRMLALKVINSDTLFKVYENTNLNLIPVISNKQKKVYVLTGPLKNGIVVFGNDYLLTFNDDGELITKKRLHKNIITINYANENADSDVGITMHSHLPETGDFITATDVCTLLLYSKFAGWSQHYVISQNYVSIWDCKKEILAILTMEAWEKITNDKEKKQKNK